MPDASQTEPLTAVLRRLRETLAPAGRDRGLLDRQVLLTAATKERLYAAAVTSEPAYRPGTNVALEQIVAELTADRRPGLASVVALTRGASRLRERPFDGQDRSEVEVFVSGAATALERVRLLAVAAHLCGIAARICLLYGATGSRPTFHAVCELGIMGGWAVFDPLANQSYLVTHHPYASAWDLMRRPAIVDAHPEHGAKATIDSSLYRVIGISSIVIEA